jgi:hypothetical protein
MSIIEIKASPSPKHITIFSKKSINILTLLTEIKCLSIEKTLLPFFSNKKCRKIGASMTVEAALVLPLFIFFFINLSCAVEMIRLHGTLQAALTNTGNRLSVYGSVLSESLETADGEGNGLLQEIGDLAFSYVYVKNEIISYAGRDYLESSPLYYGADGLQFIESEIFTTDDTFEITMTYAVDTGVQYVGIRPFRMANKYYGHIWNGYDLGGQTLDEAESGTVYITENAGVYHEDRNCTHIRLNIREVSALKISDERNSYGNKYSKCEKCGKGIMPDTLYIGSDGDKYHYSQDCPGLTRTVYSMRKSEAEKKYRACSRCSK